jgi:peptide-methionine (S)-S-oxide reductase
MPEKATFAAGCFWGVEEVFRTTKGVVSTRVGYTGGTTKKPTYEDVCTDKTGHAEAVEVTFDPKKVSFEKLLEIFWDNHDPTQLNRQGPDVGTQYRSAIYYHSAKQKAVAEKSLAKKQKELSRKIATRIAKASAFYPAEEYHQKYLMKKGANVCH